MTDDLRKKADERFEKARAEAGARDPRDFYRKALRELRAENSDAYDRAVRHFQEVLVPSIAQGETEPLTAWRDYGRLIAELTAPGRTVSLDETGRSQPFQSHLPMDRLVLHLPDEKGRRAMVVSLPPRLSPAQKAAHDLLVAGKHKVSEQS